MMRDIDEAETMEAYAKSLGDPVTNTVAAIIKVKPGFVPSDYRMKITDEFYTVDLTAKDLAEMKANPEVVSVEISRDLPLIDTVHDLP